MPLSSAGWLSSDNQRFRLGSSMRMFFFAVIPLGVEVDGLLDFSEGGLDPCFSFLGFQVLAPEEALDDDMEIDLFLDLDFEGDLEIEDLDLSRFLGNRFTQRL